MTPQTTSAGALMTISSLETLLAVIILKLLIGDRYSLID
jgi:hypothetical protein